MRARVMATALVAMTAVLGICREASAQWVVAEPALESLATTNLQFTLQAIGLQGEQIAQAVETVAQLTAVLQTVNQSLAVARSVERAYQMLRKYNWEDLQRDAKSSLYSVLPELRNAESEWNELVKNGETMRNGRFWQSRTSKDIEGDRTLFNTASYAYQVGLLAVVAPDQLNKNHVPAAERWVAYHFDRLGVSAHMAKQTMAYQIQQKKLAKLVEDAEAKEQADLRIAAAAAAAAHQTSINTQFVRDAAAADIAEREASATMRREAEQKAREEILQLDENLLDYGFVK